MQTTRTYLRFGAAPQSVTLDADEAEAIAMSLEWPADLLIMDESFIPPLRKIQIVQHPQIL